MAAPTNMSALHNDFTRLLNDIRFDTKSATLIGGNPSSSSKVKCRVCTIKEVDGKRWSECQDGCSPKMLDLLNKDVQRELSAIYPQDMEILSRHKSFMEALTAKDPASALRQDGERFRQVMSMPVTVRVIPADMYRTLFESLRDDPEFRELLTRRLPMFKDEDRMIVERYLN